MRELTMAQIVSELRKIEKEKFDGPKGFTVREAIEATGRGENWVRGRLKEMIQKGTLRCAGTRKEQNIAGMVKWVPVYQVSGRSAPSTKESR